MLISVEVFCSDERYIFVNVAVSLVIIDELTYEND